MVLRDEISNNGPDNGSEECIAEADEGEGDDAIDDDGDNTAADAAAGEGNADDDDGNYDGDAG